MAVTTSDIINIAPGLATETTARIESFIAMAEAQLDESFFGTLYDQAVAWLTAHMMTLSNRTGGVTGAIETEKVGDLMRKYAVASTATATALESTTYGAEFLRIRNMRSSPTVLTW